MSGVPDNPDVYMSGPLSAVSKDERNRLEKEVYERVYDTCNQMDLKCYCPHMSQTDTSNRQISHGEIWDIDYENVISSDVLVAYIGHPALGVGAEVEMAREAHNEILLLVESDSYDADIDSVSRLITGNPSIRALIKFKKNKFSDKKGKLQRHLFEIFSNKTLEHAAFRDDWDDETAKEMKQRLGNSGFGPARGSNNYQPLSVDDWIKEAEEYTDDDDDDDDEFGDGSGQITLT